MHRDDSDDDTDDNTDVDSFHDGWEDAIGRMTITGEAEESADDESESASYSGEEYWDEDDETDFEEVREAYHGFSAVNRPLLGGDGSSDVSGHFFIDIRPDFSPAWFQLW